MFEQLNKIVSDIGAEINKFFSNLGKVTASAVAVLAFAALIWIFMKAFKDVAAGNSNWADHLAAIISIAVLAFGAAAVAALLPA